MITAFRASYQAEDTKYNCLNK